MWTPNPKAFNHLKTLIQTLNGSEGEVYLVGGTLRDHAMQRTCSDYDLCLKGAAPAAKRFASKSGGTPVALDDTPGRETVRVVLAPDLYFDFSEMAGSCIETDLAQRDFTFNAMAVSLADFLANRGQPIDPHDGERDLREKRVRTVSDTALRADPLRLVRAFRFAAQLDFKIEAGTIERIGRDCGGIGSVAPERVWHEWKLFLGAGRVFCLLKLMQKTGILAALFPELKPHTEKGNRHETGVQAVKELQNILWPSETKVSLYPAPDLTGTHKPLMTMAALLCGLKPSIDTIATHKARRSSPRNAVAEILHRLRASNAELCFIDRAVGCCQEAVETGLECVLDLSGRSRLYHFLKRWDPELTAGLCLGWCIMASAPETGSREREDFSSRAAAVRDFYCDHYLPARKQPPLLTGNDLIKRFHLEPSPLFSTILERVEEGRILGTIRNREEADAEARKWIENEKCERPS